jgi:hypothetical protein
MKTEVPNGNVPQFRLVPSRVPSLTTATGNETMNDLENVDINRGSHLPTQNQEGGTEPPSGFILKLFQMVNGAPDKVISVRCFVVTPAVLDVAKTVGALSSIASSENVRSQEKSVRDSFNRHVLCIHRISESWSFYSIFVLSKVRNHLTIKVTSFFSFIHGHLKQSASGETKVAKLS